MRRFGTLVLALCCVLALASPVLAQPQILGPGGLYNSTGASVTVVNTTTATPIYSYVIPAGLTQGNFTPLHVRLFGTLTTNAPGSSVGTVNVGCNYGGTSATISLVNAVTFTANVTNAPITVDLYLTGYSATQSNTITVALNGRFGVVQAAGTESVYSAHVDGTTSVGAPQTLQCNWLWASASTTNSVSFRNGSLILGN